MRRPFKIALGVVGLLILVAAAAGAVGVATTPVVEIPASAQQAGWQENINDTTCAEWLDAMTDKQRLGGINEYLAWSLEAEFTAEQVRGVKRAIDGECGGARLDTVGDALGRFGGRCAYAPKPPKGCF